MPPPPWSGDTLALAADLERAVRGAVRFDDGSRALYATDASNYRQVPLGVVSPVDAADVEAAVAVCRRHGAPLLGRGGGTSLAGQGCNTAVVLDFSRHMAGVIDLDPVRRTAPAHCRTGGRSGAASADAGFPGPDHRTVPGLLSALALVSRP